MKQMFYVIIFFVFCSFGCHSKGESSVVYEDDEIVVTKVYYNESDFFLKTRYKGGVEIGDSISWSRAKGKFRERTGNIIVMSADTLLAEGMVILNDENFLVISKK